MSLSGSRHRNHRGRCIAVHCDTYPQKRLINFLSCNRLGSFLVKKKAYFGTVGVLWVRFWEYLFTFCGFMGLACAQACAEYHATAVAYLAEDISHSTAYIRDSARDLYREQGSREITPAHRALRGRILQLRFLRASHCAHVRRPYPCR